MAHCYSLCNESRRARQKHDLLCTEVIRFARGMTQCVSACASWHFLVLQYDLDSQIELLSADVTAFQW